MVSPRYINATFVVMDGLRGVDMVLSRQFMDRPHPLWEPISGNRLFHVIVGHPQILDSVERTVSTEPVQSWPA